METLQEYIEQLPEDRKEPFQRLRKTIIENLPEGFVETMSNGTIGYVVPHSIYPKGYHCDPKQPLPFMGITSKKNFITLHHLGIYADQALINWFLNEYPRYCTAKPDMGKGCMRFKKTDQIPYPLIGELASKYTPEEWVRLYESRIKR